MIKINKNPKNKIELLAPAGNLESLQAAVKHGADAVYFGIGNLNARAAAKNFTLDEAESLIDYCHDFGVKCHITLNTLLLNSEIDEVVKIAFQLFNFGADAFIIQDLGLIHRLKMSKDYFSKRNSKLELHASTQTSITNSLGVKKAAEIGFDRVVLARECSMQDVSEIAKTAKISDVKLEVFTHGAMCVSVSGQCLHSSMIGGRSGNRGGCAQPCRLKFSHGNNTGNLLSMSDQSQLYNLPRFIKAGVSSLKIEGRMKPAEYVAFVVEKYRKAIDLYYEQGESSEFKNYISNAEKQIAIGFSRNSKLSHGYSGDDENLDKNLIDIHEASYPRELPGVDDKNSIYKRRELKIKFRAITGEKANLIAGSGENKVELYGEIVQIAEKSALEKNRVIEILMQLGDTPFLPGEVDIELSENAFLSVSQIKKLRRDACEYLINVIRKNSKSDGGIASTSVFIPEDIVRKKTSICVVVCDEASASAAIKAGADEIYIKPRNISSESIASLCEYAYQNKGANVCFCLPSFQSEFEIKAIDKMFASSDLSGFSGALISNISHFKLFETYFENLILAPSMNITNSWAVSEMLELGASDFYVSPEINNRDIKEILKITHGGLQVYGKIATMSFAHCPRKTNGLTCDNCVGCIDYIDRKGEKLSMSAYKTKYKNELYCSWEMYNSRCQDLSRFGDKLRELEAGKWFLQFGDYDEHEIKYNISKFIRLRDGEDVSYDENSTGGHFMKGFDKAKTQIRRK